ncbi:hypothetical protein O3P69_004164 [Scylla paramamosain]|uniref:Uncharacterized protein n=1 Tax=Scylla paramamosain TaxID=85552 RepID=A0AAW0UFF6_SCYPA
MWCVVHACAGPHPHTPLHQLPEQSHGGAPASVHWRGVSWPEQSRERASCPLPDLICLAPPRQSATQKANQPDNQPASHSQPVSQPAAGSRVSRVLCSVLNFNALSRASCCLSRTCASTGDSLT